MPGFKLTSFGYQSPFLTNSSIALDTFPLLGSACHILGTQPLTIYNLQIWLLWVCPEVWSPLSAAAKFSFSLAQPKTIFSPLARGAQSGFIVSLQCGEPSRWRGPGRGVACRYPASRPARPSSRPHAASLATRAFAPCPAPSARRGARC